MRSILPLLVVVLSAVSVFAQEAAPQPQFSPEYITQVREAVRAFQSRDFEGTTAALDKADALQPPTPTTLNIRGAVAIEQQRFDEGRKLCEDALKLEPKFFPAKFNLAEIPFLQKKV
jgi:Flp pilus assembly protein TadD